MAYLRHGNWPGMALGGGKGLEMRQELARVQEGREEDG